MMIFYLTAGSRQHIYQDMKDYVVIGLMKLSWSNPSDKLINDSICIILWSNTCMVFIS